MGFFTTSKSPGVGRRTTERGSGRISRSSYAEESLKEGSYFTRMFRKSANQRSSLEKMLSGAKRQSFWSTGWTAEAPLPAGYGLPPPKQPQTSAWPTHDSATSQGASFDNRLTYSEPSLQETSTYKRRHRFSRALEAASQSDARHLEMRRAEQRSLSRPPSHAADARGSGLTDDGHGRPKSTCTVVSTAGAEPTVSRRPLNATGPPVSISNLLDDTGAKSVTFLGGAPSPRQRRWSAESEEDMAPQDPSAISVDPAMKGAPRPPPPRRALTSLFRTSSGDIVDHN